MPAAARRKDVFKTPRPPGRSPCSPHFPSFLTSVRQEPLLSRSITTRPDTQAYGPTPTAPYECSPAWPRRLARRQWARQTILDDAASACGCRQQTSPNPPTLRVADLSYQDARLRAPHQGGRGRSRASRAIVAPNRAEAARCRSRGQRCEGEGVRKGRYRAEETASNSRRGQGPGPRPRSHLGTIPSA
jgi:hypothetical protein